MPSRMRRPRRCHDAAPVIRLPVMSGVDAVGRRPRGRWSRPGCLYPATIWAVATAAACDRSAPTPPESVPSAPRAPTVLEERIESARFEDRPGPPLPDTTIDENVTAKLLEATAGEMSDIRFEVQRGIVILRGRTRSEAARARAAELAGGTRGVRAVVNLVRPSLKGQLPTDEARRAAEEDARSAWGVRSVDSRLTIRASER